MAHEFDLLTIAENSASYAAFLDTLVELCIYHRFSPSDLKEVWAESTIPILDDNPSYCDEPLKYTLSLIKGN